MEIWGIVCWPTDAFDRKKAYKLANAKRLYLFITQTGFKYLG